MTAIKQTVLLIDRIGYSHYRRPDGRSFFEDYEVVVLTDRAKLSQVRGGEILAAVGIDIDDVALLESAARLLHERFRVDRIVAVSERLLLPAARLREALGVPGMGSADTRIFRHKLRMKEHLIAHGVRVPDFAPFTVAHAVTLLEKYPRIVLKPVDGMSSIGVFVLDSEASVRRLAQERPDLNEETYDVEQHIDGMLYHIDTVVSAGTPTAVNVSCLVDPTTSFTTLAPSRSVNLADGPEREALIAFNRQVLACYPWYSGVTHHEVFLDRAGRPVFCEIAARPGGGGIIAGFQHRTGINLDEAAVMAQLTGEVPKPTADRTDLTGFVMVYGQPGPLRALPERPDEPWILEFDTLRKVGDVLAAPTRWAEAVVLVAVTGRTEHEVTERLDAMARHAGVAIGTRAA
ncbi:MAG TPA: hypothetical protein VHT91_30160 [Kofleriaceae bacterium]|jgi:hypothetical protein|nr:hypothetical protein [Kofleriaceae bacterium]